MFDVKFIALVLQDRWYDTLEPHAQKSDANVLKKLSISGSIVQNVNKRNSGCPVLIAIALFYLPVTPVWAGTPTSPGPFLYYEQTQSTRVTPEKSPNESAETSPVHDGKVAVKQHGVSILAPIPAKIFDGILILRTDYRKESRNFSNDDAAARSLHSAGDWMSPELLAPGVIYLPHAAEGGPRWFLLAARYGSIRFKDVPHFMGEYVAGFDLMDHVPIRFSVNDMTRTRFLVRLRQFPHANRWLFLAEHSIFSADGWFFSASIPAHLIGGWETPSGDFHLESGVRFKSKEFPVDYGSLSGEGKSDAPRFGWLEGYTTTVFASTRHRIFGALFAGVEAGLWAETLESYLEDGEKIGGHTTRFTPYGRLALETHFVTP